jgi:hypothetical protein
MDTNNMPARAIPRAPETETGTINRLLVLLPDEDIDEAALSNALWTMAARNGAAIRVIAAIRDWADEPQAQLRLGLLTALLRESGLGAETEIVRDAELLRVAVERRKPGDLVICPAGVSTPDGRAGLIQALHPLSVVFSPLGQPVRELPGIVRPRVRRVLREWMTWLLPLAIVIGSLFLEIAFVRVAGGMANWARQLAIAAYTALELASIAWLARARPSR